MTPHKQLYRHRPADGVYGDCQRTVFACLFDLDGPEAVPHFGRDDPPDGVFWDRVDAWLRERGYSMFQVAFPGETPLADVLLTMGTVNPGTFYMLSGQSRNKCNHVVICVGNAICHDTSLDDSGVVAPWEGYWRVEVLVPLRFTNKKPLGDVELPAGGALEAGAPRDV